MSVPLTSIRARTFGATARASSHRRPQHRLEPPALFGAYAKGGDNAELKGWAFSTLSHLREYLSMAEKLK